MFITPNTGNPERTITDNILWTWLDINIKLDSEIHLPQSIMTKYQEIASLPTFKYDTISYCKEIQDIEVDPVIKYYVKQYLLDNSV
jgi:hypothetical protein